MSFVSLNNPVLYTITDFKRPRKTLFTNFPKSIDTSKLKLFGYLQGERIDRCKYADIDFFDHVHFLCESDNAKNGNHFIHAIVRIEATKQNRVVVLCC